MLCRPTTGLVQQGIDTVASSPLLQPRVMFAGGCTASTFTLRLATELMQLVWPNAGAVHNRSNELTWCAYNPYCEVKRPFVSQTDAYAEPEALQKVATHYAATHGGSLVFKASSDHTTKCQSKALQELGTHTVILVPDNVLKVSLCEVRDCFTWIIAPEQGHMVDRSTGEVVAGVRNHKANPHAREPCNMWRRGLPSEKQPLVWLNTSTLVKTLQDQQAKYDSWAEKLQQSHGWPRHGLQRAEALLAWETSKDEADLKRSVASWRALMDIWQVPLNASTIEAFLRQHPQWGSRPTTPLPIANFEEVQTTLAGGTYSWMLDVADAHTHR